MALPDISKLTVSELEQLIKACSAQIDTRRKAAKKELAKQFKDMAGDETSSLIASLISRHLWWKGRGEQRRASAILSQAQELWRLTQNSRQTVERSIHRDFSQLYDGVLNDIIQCCKPGRDSSSTISTAIQVGDVRHLRHGTRAKPTLPYDISSFCIKNIKTTPAFNDENPAFSTIELQ